MKTSRQENVSDIFYKVVKNEEPIESLIKEVKKSNSLLPEKYAYQAFCCAILARKSNNYILKGKYIKQYSMFMSKSLVTDKECIIAKLIRFLIESNLKDVKFTSHIKDDLSFLKDKIDFVKNDNLKQLIINAL